MIRHGLLALALLAPINGLLEAEGQSIDFRVKAGEHDRDRTPIRFEVAEDRLGPEVRRALDSGPVAVGLGRRSGNQVSQSIAQVDRPGVGKPARVTFVLPTPLKKGEEARFRLLGSRPLGPDGPSETPLRWSMGGEVAGGLDLMIGGRPVFRYNSGPVSSPNYKEIQNRDAYIHPAYSPSGKLITGDFSPFHPHHRGFFLAYERTNSGDLAPDFWNIHHGSGKIYADGLDKSVAGPVTASFSARHRWEAKVKATGESRVVLRERWDVEAIEIPGSPYWLFDLTSTQQAVDRPLELLPYRYGGMAYRGPEPFVKGTLDVLNSEGQHRRDADQKPARWVDLTGPVAEGSADYAGAMIADHPENPHYPTVARIHPTSLPFFCFVPAHDKALTIGKDTPTVFRYRVLIHDGHPDPVLDEKIARDFAEPPSVEIEPIGR
ncbi:PmoA family protein [Tundrisphaera lichenicola]|uniref:DUF6807 domain-containing protein n=1 Tax=Tundrisphaera lichenicola TaxID=2029860 RepID=UPI003EBDAD79